MTDEQIFGAVVRTDERWKMNENDESFESLPEELKNLVIGPTAVRDVLKGVCGRENQARAMLAQSIRVALRNEKAVPPK